MLKQFFTDWEASINSRTKIKEHTSQNGVVDYQETEFTFRNVKIKMYIKLKPGDENRPESSRRWFVEMYVPSTNKPIHTSGFTKAKCAEAILMAITPGRDHEDRIQARKNNLRKKIVDELIARRREKLSKTYLTAEEVEWTINWMEDNMVAGRAAWNETLTEVLVKYSGLITGRDLGDYKLDGRDASLFITRMFNTACTLISEMITDKNGFKIMTRKSIANNFLSPKDNIVNGVYVVRVIYSKINDLCFYSSKMAHIVNFMGAYYGTILNKTVEEGIAELKARRDAKFNRNMENKFHVKPTGGYQHKQAISLVNNIKPVGATVGDMFGDILDSALVSYTPESVIEQNQVEASTEPVTSESVAEVPVEEKKKTTKRKKEKTSVDGEQELKKTVKKPRKSTRKTKVIFDELDEDDV